MIAEYFRQVRAILYLFAHITDDFNISEKVYSTEKGFITGRLRFSNGCVLEFGEVKNTLLQSKVKYRFHFMDKNGDLIFR